MNNFHDQGRAAYQRGDYKKALECFDKAIGRGSPSARLLDNRAACHEKLNDLSAALKDAKQIIQIHRADPTGYLRAGKVLTKMGKEKQSVALEIYRHGLKSVVHVGQGYELLKKAHKEIQDIVSPSKVVDPLLMLPRELAETILEYLSFRQRINACRVSRGWANFIRSSSNLWSHLDLSQTRKKVPASFISRAINNGRSKLRKASLHKVANLDKSLAAIVRNCQLEELVLLECVMRDTVVEHLQSPKANHLRYLDVSSETITRGQDVEAVYCCLADNIEAFTSDALLESAVVLHKAPKLKTLTLTNVRFLRGLILNLPDYAPNITSLTLREALPPPAADMTLDLSMFLTLTELELSITLADSEHLILPQTIRSLKLDLQRPATGLGCLIKPGVPLRFPALEELSIKPSVHKDDIHRLLELPVQGNKSHTGEPTKLRTLSLSIEHEKDVEDVLLECINEPRLQNLERLRLGRGIFIDDNYIPVIVRGLRNLRCLDLTESRVTGVGVREALKAQHLEELILDRCNYLGADAVPWARSQGIRVSNKKGHEGGGGRKVQY